MPTKVEADGETPIVHLKLSRGKVQSKKKTELQSEDRAVQSAYRGHTPMSPEAPVKKKYRANQTRNHRIKQDCIRKV